jgi:3'(2'), 5'-bisphosphate nucleotidase
MDNLLFNAINAAIQAGKAINEIYQTDFSVEFKEDASPLTIADKASHKIIYEALTKTNFPVLSEEGREIPYEERKLWKKFWLVDPLDGTKEFVKKNGDFTVNIALVENQKAILGIIYAPVSDELFYGMDNYGAFKVSKASAFSSMSALKNSAIRLPATNSFHEPVVVASRSHLSAETIEFIDKLKINQPGIRIESKGSSLKICIVAENPQAIYPRFAPTFEWDTAAGHAILNAAGGVILIAENQERELIYNKENLLNPWFIALFKTN